MKPVTRDSLHRQGNHHLTPREETVARLIARGLRNKDIAERIGVAPATVKAYLSNIYAKLHVGRTQLALLGVTTVTDANKDYIVSSLNTLVLEARNNGATDAEIATALRDLADDLDAGELAEDDEPDDSA